MLLSQGVGSLVESEITSVLEHRVRDAPSHSEAEYSSIDNQRPWVYPCTIDILVDFFSTAYSDLSLTHMRISYLCMRAAAS